MLTSWLGDLDKLARTAAALGVYLLTTWLERTLGWKPSWIVGEGLAVLLSLLVSGLASTRIWARPRLNLLWTVADHVHDEDTYQLRSGDARGRRVITHSVVISRSSILSWLVFRQLRNLPLKICIRPLPSGVFHLSEDMSLSTVVYESWGAGFCHNLPDLDQIGTIAITRVEWELVQPGLHTRCKVKYKLECLTGNARWLRFLVHLDFSIKAVELGP